MELYNVERGVPVMVYFTDGLADLCPEPRNSEAVPELATVQFKVQGGAAFKLELELNIVVREVKLLAQEFCHIEPVHMRLTYGDRTLKEGDTLQQYQAERDVPVMVLVTKESGWEPLLDPGKMHSPGVRKMPRVQGTTTAGSESQLCCDNPKADLQHWVADGGRS